MLVNFKRDFFAADGTLYSKGTREFNGPVEDKNGNSLLPSTAQIVDENGHLPVQANTPKAGHGAKPLEEQVLDLIPGAGETHQIQQADGGGAAPVLTAEERHDKETAAEKQRSEEREAAKKGDDAEAKELAKDVKTGVANAEKAAEQVKEMTDPLSPFNSPTKPKK